MLACVQIQKEEVDYATHIQNNWQQSSSSQQQQQRLRLNTIGAAQLINPSLAAKTCDTAQPAHSASQARLGTANSAAAHKQASAASNSSSLPAAAKAGSRAGSVVSAAATGSVAAKAPAQIPAAPASHVSVARSSTGTARSTVSRASTRLTAAAPGSEAGSRVQRSSAVGAGANRGASVAGSAVSHPCTPNFSEVGSSVATSEVGVYARQARCQQQCWREWPQQ